MEGFDECPEQRANAFASTEDFHQTHDTKEPKEIDTDHVRTRLQAKDVHRSIAYPSDSTDRDDVTVDDIDQTANDDDEVTAIRWIAEVILETNEQHCYRVDGNRRQPFLTLM